MTTDFEDVADILSKNNPVFTTFLFYAALLSIKLLAMSLITGNNRFKYKSFANPEDLKLTRGAKLNLAHPEVERSRRAHLNDLENIPVFFVLAVAYMLTNPNQYLAINLIRIFAASRIIHTVVYAIMVLPQPARGLAFWGGNLVNWYMALSTLFHFM